jgi:hypothetical protein
MRRKLVILNLALVAASIYAGVHVRGQLHSDARREAGVLDRRVEPAAPPPLPALPPVPPVLPVDYADVAEKMLLDKSRNSTVVVEPPPAPAPVPMPPLPVYHGQMRLPGEGLIVILSATGGAGHEAVHPGEMIGPFKLVEANSQEIAFEWQGQIVRKNLEQLIDRAADAAPAQAAAASVKPSTAPPPAAPKTQAGPGQQLNPDVRACVSNDSYDDGAVVDGYRKVVKPGPFGTACQWNRID